MNFSKAIIISILQILLAASFTAQQEDGFNNFLIMALEDYHSWAISNGKEPSPIVGHSVNLTTSTELVTISGEIRNHKFYGYSNLWFSPLSSDLLGGSFSMDGGPQNFSVTAEYEVSGSVFGSTPVSGSGILTIVAGSARTPTGFEKFAVTADGYINLTAGTWGFNQGVYFSDYSFRFENLSAGGYESHVADLMENAYFDRFDQWLPFPDLMKDYLQELFEATPLSEIVGTTLRPPTTPQEPSTLQPTTYSTTTTTPEPTCPPCEQTEVTCIVPTCPSLPSCPPPGTQLPPKFSRNVYQTTLAQWPTNGSTINLRIRADVEDGAILRYELLTPFSFVELDDEQNIVFTSDISEGVYVGPNNVMILEVIAAVAEYSDRKGLATVLIVFPKVVTSENLS